MYPYPNKICGLCLSNLKNAYEFKQRCINAFDKLMRLSDFNTIYPNQSDETKPIMQVDVDVLIDENDDAVSEEHDTYFDNDDTFFNENESVEPQVNMAIVAKN